MDALQALTDTPAYKVLTFQKIHQKSNFVQAGIEYTYSQIFMYTQGDQKVSVHLMITIQKSGALRLFDQPVQ